MAPPPFVPSPLPPIESDSWSEASEHEATAAAPALAAAMGAASVATTRPGDIEGSFVNDASASHSIPPPAARVTPAPTPAPSAGPTQDWKQVARAEVNPRWFWRVAGGALGVLLLLVVAFGVFARSASKPGQEPDSALRQHVDDQKAAISETKKLFAAGKYDECLAKAHAVLRLSPNNEDARKYARMAESAIAERKADSEKSTRVTDLVAAARTALSENKDEEAKHKAEEALGLDAANAEATSIRDEANRRINEAKVAAEAARRKETKPREQAAKKKESPKAEPSARPAVAAVSPAPPPPSASTTATLRVVMDSPVPEGTVMLMINNQTTMTQRFAFKSGEKRSISAAFKVPVGSLNVRIYLLSQQTPGAIAATTLQLAGDETRTVQLEFADGKLLIRS